MFGIGQVFESRIAPGAVSTFFGLQRVPLVIAQAENNLDIYRNIFRRTVLGHCRLKSIVLMISEALVPCFTMLTRCHC